MPLIKLEDLAARDMPLKIDLDNINKGIRKLIRHISMLNFNDEDVVPYLIGVVSTLRVLDMANLSQDIRELSNVRNESDFKRIQYNIVSQIQPERNIPEQQGKKKKWYI